MRNITRARWVAWFDMEELVSVILMRGMVLSAGLVLGGLVMRWAGHGQVGFGPNLHARSIPTLILTDLRAGESFESPRLWLHLGIAALLLTPYARILASVFYFTLVERSRKHALLAAFVLGLMTVILLTDLV